MRKLKKVVLFAFGLATICSLNFAPAASAQEAQIGIKIVPAIVEDLVKPGEIISRELRVTNKSGKELEMFAYLRDFKAADEYGKAELIVPGTESGNYISSWIKISDQGVKFAPGEERVIPYTIEMPADVGPGGYYGAIVFGTQAPRTRAGEAEKGAAIGIAQQATSLIFLQVEGKSDERADIREFKTDKGLYSTPFNVKFTTKIENFGNVHVRPAGVIEVKNTITGKKVASLMVNEDRHNVLPKSARIFENFWKENFGFGKYEASLALSYGTPADKGGDGRKTVTMVREFWILPMKMVMSFVLSLIVTIGLFVFFLKMYKKRAIKEAMEKMGGSRRAVHASVSPVKNYFSTFSILLLAVIVIMMMFYFVLF
jgi:hypothetical protein